MSRADGKAVANIVAASERLFRAARGQRRKDAKLAAMLITAIATSVRDGVADAGELRALFLMVAGASARRENEARDAGE